MQTPADPNEVQPTNIQSKHMIEFDRHIPTIN